MCTKWTSSSSRTPSGGQPALPTTRTGTTRTTKKNKLRSGQGAGRGGPDTQPDSLGRIGRDLRRQAGTLGGVVVLLWAIELVDVVLLGGALDVLGILPRSPAGLIGIFLHPLLHLGPGHLAVNTIGILLFGGLVMLRDPRDFWTAVLLGTLVGGIGVWLFGRPSIHIGASGVVFALFGYLLLTGWFDRRMGAILLSAVVFLLWGSALFGLSPLQRGVSWEAHLFGFLAGGLTAWLRSRRRSGAKTLPRS